MIGKLTGEWIGFIFVAWMHYTTNRRDLRKILVDLWEIFGLADFLLLSPFRTFAIWLDASIAICYRVRALDRIDAAANTCKYERGIYGDSGESPVWF